MILYYEQRKACGDTDVLEQMDAKEAKLKAKYGITDEQWKEYRFHSARCISALQDLCGHCAYYDYSLGELKTASLQLDIEDGNPDCVHIIAKEIRENGSATYAKFFLDIQLIKVRSRFFRVNEKGEG